MMGDEDGWVAIACMCTVNVFNEPYCTVQGENSGILML